MATGFLEGRANLAGKVTAIVGGGGGIGAAVSMALADPGVDLVICNIDADALSRTATAIRAKGGKSHCLYR